MDTPIFYPLFGATHRSNFHDVSNAASATLRKSRYHAKIGFTMARLLALYAGSTCDAAHFMPLPITSSPCTTSCCSRASCMADAGVGGVGCAGAPPQGAAAADGVWSSPALPRSLARRDAKSTGAWADAGAAAGAGGWCNGFSFSS